MPCFHLYSQVFHILEAVPQVAQEWVVQVLQHPSFSYYIPHAFRADDFIFSDVFECEGKTGIFAFDNSNFAKGTFAYYSQEAEVVEVDFIGHTYGLAA
jgi:D-lyxose ketol-isomerase